MKLAARRLLARFAAPSRHPSGLAPFSFDDYRHGVALLDQVRHEMRGGAFEAAEANLAEARLRLGSDQAVLIASAEIAQAQAHWPEAQSRWQCVIDVYPETTVAYAQRALAVLGQGDVLGAAELYHQLMLRFPGDVGAPISIVNLLDRLRAPDREKFAAIAEAGLDQLIRTHPNYTILLLTQARLARSREDWTAALASLAKAREIDKSDSRIWAEIREVLEIIENRREKTHSLFDREAKRT